MTEAIASKAPTTLGALLKALNDCAGDEDKLHVEYGINMQNLPTFGGHEPAQGNGIFSWDVQNYLCGKHGVYWITPRADFHPWDSGDGYAYDPSDILAQYDLRKIVSSYLMARYSVTVDKQRMVEAYDKALSSDLWLRREHGEDAINTNEKRFFEALCGGFAERCLEVNVATGESNIGEAANHELGIAMIEIGRRLIEDAELGAKAAHNNTRYVG